MTPLLAAVVTFSIQSAAFFAEVFRAGIISVERGQWDGARAIGMTHGQALRRIVLPQAVKRMIPAFMERAIELMKTTTLVATIAYADLLFAANEIAQKTFRPLETFTVAALIYFVVITAFSVLARRLERRPAVSGESTGHRHGMGLRVDPRQCRCLRCRCARYPADLRDLPGCGPQSWPGRRTWSLFAAAHFLLAGDGVRRILPQHAGAGAD